MSNLDLTIAKIMKGDTEVLKIMQGDTEVWPAIPVVTFSITTNLTNITSDAPAAVNENSSLIITLTPDTGYYIDNSSIEVIMGSTDITSTAYSNGVITIASVTDNVVITAVADVPYIIFEDANVKSICVTNWGGGTYAGEITPAEAAAVTSLGGKFYQNNTITKFNELRYFTGLTSLNYNSTSGQFYQCTGLTQVTLPPNVSNLLGAFRDTRIVNLDLTPITATGLNIRNMCRGNTALKTVALPETTYGNNWGYTFDGNSNLTTISIVGTANLNNVGNFESSFNNASKLATITGAFSNIKQSINFKSCPLSVASATIVLNGVVTATSKSVTFKSSLKTTYEADADFVTARDAAIALGWSITYA